MIADFVRDFEEVSEVYKKVAPHIRSLDAPYLGRLDCVALAEKFREVLSFCIFLSFKATFLDFCYKMKMGAEKCNVLCR